MDLSKAFDSALKKLLLTKLKKKGKMKFEWNAGKNGGGELEKYFSLKYTKLLIALVPVLRYTFSSTKR